MYKEAKQKAPAVVAKVQETKRNEFASELDNEEGKKNVFRITK